MKFQNLKLEKERQRNLRSKNEKAFKRKREYFRHGELRTVLRMSSDCLRDNHRDSGYEFALWMNQWVSEWEWVSLRGRRERVWVSECVWTFRFWNGTLKELCVWYISAYLESYKLDIYVAPPGNFVQIRLAQNN